MYIWICIMMNASKCAYTYIYFYVCTYLNTRIHICTGRPPWRRHPSLLNQAGGAASEDGQIQRLWHVQVTPPRWPGTHSIIWITHRLYVDNKNQVYYYIWIKAHLLKMGTFKDFNTCKSLTRLDGQGCIQSYTYT